MLEQLRGNEDSRNRSQTTKGVVFIRNAPYDFVYNVACVSTLGFMSGIAKSYFDTWDQKVHNWPEIRRNLVSETMWFGIYAATFFGAKEAYWGVCCNCF
jgi:hypothetical protein